MSTPIRHRPDVLPAEGDDAVAFCAARLRESADVQRGLRQLGGERRGVFEGPRPSEQPDRFVVVREFRQAGGRPDRLSGLDRVPVQVLTSCPADLGHKRKWHRVMHRKIRAALEGQTFDASDLPVSVSRSLTPVRRTQKPVTVGYEEETGQATQTAMYDVVIAPATPAGS